MVLAELQIQDKGRVDLVKQLDEFIIVVGDISAGPINDHGFTKFRTMVLRIWPYFWP